MGARQSTTRQDKDIAAPPPEPVPAARREGLNAPAAALCGAGLSSLLAYRLAAPRAVTGVSSPGAVAGRALALGTLLSVGTFSFIIGGLAAAYDVRTASEAVTAARRAAPPRVEIKFRAPTPSTRNLTHWLIFTQAPPGLRLTSEPSPADEAAWRRIDADLKRAWDASDWTAFDDACRRAFARLAGD